MLLPNDGEVHLIVAETDRLVIRWLNEADAEFIHLLFNTDGFLQFVGDRNIRSIEDGRNYLQNGPLGMYQHVGIGLYMVELKSENQPLGICGLIKRDSLDDIDIGYGFLPDHAGLGYAYESAVAVVEYAKSELNLKRLVAITTSDNARSIKLLERLGLTFESNVEEPADAPALGLYATDLYPTTSDRNV